MTADEFLALYDKAIIRSEGEIWAKRKNPFERVVAAIRSLLTTKNNGVR